MILQDMEEQPRWLLDCEALGFEHEIEGVYPWVDVGFIEDFDEERLGEYPPDPEYGEMIDWFPPHPGDCKSQRTGAVGVVLLLQHSPVAADHLAVPARRVFQRAFLSGVVHMDQPEARTVAH